MSASTIGCGVALLDGQREARSQHGVEHHHGMMTVFGSTGTDLYHVVPGAADNGTTVIAGFKAGVDQMRFFGGITQADVQQNVVGGNIVFTLDDGATIILAGMTTLAPNSVVF